MLFSSLSIPQDCLHGEGNGLFRLFLDRFLCSGGAVGEVL